jgi:mannose-6-phosphate isomerase
MEIRFDKPWGWELEWAVGPSTVGRLVHVRRGHRLWLDAHNPGEERLVLCAGLLTLVSEDDRGHLSEQSLSPGHVYEIPAGTPHRLVAIEDSDLLSVGPPTLDEVVHVEDL